MLNTDDLAEDDAADLISQVASASDAAPGGFRRSSAYLKVDASRQGQVQQALEPQYL
jgi:hypothetical protein